MVLQIGPTFRVSLDVLFADEGHTFLLLLSLVDAGALTQIYVLLQTLF
jgi:hypothetical protein